MHVLIPTAGCLPCLRLTIESFRCTSPSLPITVVANGVDPETREYLIHLSGGPIETVWLDETAGFPAAVNAGLKSIEDRDDVLLANDDVVMLDASWEAKVNGILESQRENLAGIGPVSNYVLEHQMYTAPGPPIHKTNHISFFWAVLTKEALEDVGLLDEGFGLGYCEDLDWCLRASKKGYHFIIDRGNLVWHWGSQTMQELVDPLEQDRASRELLNRKHPELSS